MKGLEGKYLIITEDYTDSEVGVWSGWRDSNSHLTSNSQIEILFCNFNGFNLVNLTLFELPNMRKRTKISPKV